MPTSITTDGVEFNNSTVQTTAVPDNVIIMWYGSLLSIPTGWKLCDGTNGTPDLRDKFIVGAGSTYAVGATGGVTTVTLTAPQLPTHTHPYSSLTVSPAGDHAHTLTFSSTGDHNHPYPTSLLTNASGRPFLAGPGTLGGTTTTPAGNHSHPVFNSPTDNTHTHTVTATTEPTGGSGSHDNLPPYYGIALLMRI